MCIECVARVHAMAACAADATTADAFPDDLKLYMFVRAGAGVRRGSTRIGAVSDVRRRLAMYNRSNDRGSGAPWRIGLVLVLPRARRLRTRELVRYWKSRARIPYKRAQAGFALARELALPLFVWPATLEGEGEMAEQLTDELARTRALATLDGDARRQRALATLARARASTRARVNGVSVVHRDARRRARTPQELVRASLSAFM